LIRALGGAWHETGNEWRAGLSPAARALVERSVVDLDPARLVDVHVHLAGIGAGGSGCEIHPHMRSWLSPLTRVRFELYLSAAGIGSLEQADREYAERLQRLVSTSPGAGRFCLLAFDHAYHEDGSLDREKSEFHVPNEYAWAVASTSESLLPAISVHPYRRDALDELERWAARGVRLVKWLPNAMGIDPASPRCDAFYDHLREHDMTLLTHTGKELAVEADEQQALGNPLRLRRALDRGVRVIAAHCASLGQDEDLDQPEGARVQRPSFELFLRLMDEPRYEGLLFGELSALTQVNRLGAPLLELLERRDLHARLVNGSDYPLPALNVLIHLDALVELGVLPAEQAEPLRELYRAHPLAFDLALKRSLRSPVTGHGFEAEAFLLPKGLQF
jgi:mannonate dehydratase